MSSFISVEEARTRPGLRLVLTVGVPGPWGEAAKGILVAKGLAFARVPQTGGQANPELLAWTGVENAPQLVIDDAPALTGWAEILLRAERLAPEPRLLPEDAAERALVFGLAHELMGQGGFCWTRRLMMIHPLLQLPVDNPVRAFGDRLASRYGCDEAVAPARLAAILRMLSDRLADQKRAGSPYLVGDALTAADIYWAATCALVAPLPAEVCPMSDMMRGAYGSPHPAIDEALEPELLAHRDRIYQAHMEYPVVLE